MSSTINASTTGGGGVITTADASGNLNIQSGGTTVVAVTSAGAAVTGTLSATGVSTFPAGTALLPAITTTGDTNTGVWFPAADTVAVSTSGAEAVRIDSSGNLLAGTTAAYGISSAGNTHIAGGSSQQLFLRHTAAAAGKYWKLGADNGANNMTVMNNSGAGVYMVDGGNTWSSASDERLKTDLIPIENGLDKVNSLRSVTGRFKTDEVGISRSFLIAQDVQAVLPEAVSIQDSRLGILGVAYTDVIPLLVAAIQELKAIIDTQNARIESLEAN